jgi:Spy/CpxP family protein refolding chaperone
MPPRRTRVLLAGFFASVLFSSVLLAQQPGGGQWGMPGGHGGHHGWGGGMGGHYGGQQRAPDPVVTEGPPQPDDFDGIVQLADSQRPAYEQLYANLMDSTQAKRDSLRAAREVMRDAFQSRDRSTIEDQGKVIRGITSDLEKRQKNFDDALKQMLDKDQWKRYQDWRAQRRKEMEDRMQGFRRGGSTS